MRIANAQPTLFLHSKTGGSRSQDRSTRNPPERNPRLDVMSDPATVPPANPSDVHALFERVYDELHRIASRQLARRGRGTVTTTALVHEAYLRLAQGRETEWHDRAHFFALAARAMRFVLVDRARARVARKRGGAHPVTLDDGVIADAGRPDELLAIHEALDRLSAESERLAHVVHLRFFAGLGYDEIATLMGVSVPTVKRDWARARVWLHRFMTEGEAHPRPGAP